MKLDRVECEFGGGRLASVSERVSFLVEKVDKGIKVAIKGREAGDRRDYPVCQAQRVGDESGV